MTPTSRKLEIFENIDAGEGFGHTNRPNFFAGANFIVSRRRGLQFKCLVEWLHRREIAPAGAIIRRIEVVRCGRFRCSRSIFVTEIDAIMKSVRISSS